MPVALQATEMASTSAGIKSRFSRANVELTNFMASHRFCLAYAPFHQEVYNFCDA